MSANGVPTYSNSDNGKLGLTCFTLNLEVSIELPNKIFVVPTNLKQNPVKSEGAVVPQMASMRRTCVEASDENIKRTQSYKALTSLMMASV